MFDRLCVVVVLPSCSTYAAPLSKVDHELMVGLMMIALRYHHGMIDPTNSMTTCPTWRNIHLARDHPRMTPQHRRTLPRPSVEKASRASQNELHHGVVDVFLTALVNSRMSMVPGTPYSDVRVHAIHSAL